MSLSRTISETTADLDRKKKPRMMPLPDGQKSVNMCIPNMQYRNVMDEQTD